MVIKDIVISDIYFYKAAVPAATRVCLLCRKDDLLCHKNTI